MKLEACRKDLGEYKDSKLRLVIISISLFKLSQRSSGDFEVLSYRL